MGFRPQTLKLRLHCKKKGPYENTAEEVSFEWKHHRISSTDAKVIMTNRLTIT